MKTNKTSLLILDRDGVINYDSDDYIKSEEEWVPIPGSIESIAQLSQAGFTIVVATNQSGLARGYFDELTLAAMHEKLHKLVEDAGGHIAGIFICTHLPSDQCSCRKPRTGLLDQVEEEFGTSVQGTFFVGDSEKDLDCALAMGCHPILVETGKGKRTLEVIDKEKLSHCQVFKDLFSASTYILSSQQTEI